MREEEKETKFQTKTQILKQLFEWEREREEYSRCVNIIKQEIKGENKENYLEFKI